MKTLANHKGMQLRDDAAASWDRLERDHGKRTVTSAARTVAQQNALIFRYDHPKGPQDRPPNLFKPAPSSGPNASRHLSGIAIDTPDASANRALYAAYGFRFLFEYDRVHLEYDPAYDQHKAKPARPLLVRGSRGQDVRDLQTILNRYHGTHLRVDGVYGTDTRDRVAEFQHGHGLNPDGKVGPLTWRKLGQ